MTGDGTIWLVRHAPTDWTGLRWCGRADPELTPAGRDLARAVASSLAAEAPARTPVWTSPLRRARETADAIAAALGSTMVVVNELIEVDVGRAEGLTWGELSAREPDVAAAIERGGPVDWPVGESGADLAGRAATFARRASAAAAIEGGIVVVSHGAFLHALARALWEGESVPLEAGGILRIGARIAE